MNSLVIGINHLFYDVCYKVPTINSYNKKNDFLWWNLSPFYWTFLWYTNIVMVISYFCNNLHIINWHFIITFCSLMYRPAWSALGCPEAHYLVPFLDTLADRELFSVITNTKLATGHTLIYVHERASVFCE